MKYISEVQLGALGNGAGMGGEEATDELNTRTFRPTEAQKVVLANIQKLAGGGGVITTADAMNVPQEELEKKQLDQSNMEGAFQQLEDIGLIEVDQEGVVVLTPEGEEEAQQIEDAMPMDGEEPADFEGDADLDAELGAGPEDELGGDPEMDMGGEEGRGAEEPGYDEDGMGEEGMEMDMTADEEEERPRRRYRESFSLIKAMQGSLLESALLKKLR